ncbi:MAG: anaerobic carbon-monoxide dehydrogenase catalytic subunit [Planctomycetes bacterium]|nr:anaerobic carbon-monoxide dehydrogenase catalytic subunit [Planctomycetota bacterium]
MTKDKQPRDPAELTCDPATERMIRKARAERVGTAWDRFEAQQPQCRYGELGICCRNCAMGPCRVRDDKAGVCGATASTVAARNFARMVAAGAAAHADHARGVAETFLAAARGEAAGYAIRDERKLFATARRLEIATDGKSAKDVAVAVGEKALSEFGRQHGELAFARRAPEPRLRLWRELGAVPRGIDREIVEVLHRTHMGVDQDYRNLTLQATRAALADGWGGSMIATELQDVLFKTPEPVRSRVNLGVLRKDEVNLVVHGHEPLLSEMIVRASRDPELLRLAASKGAKGINVAGLCCTSNEILMRHGIPVAGNFLQQEAAVVTGAVEALVADVQCVMQSLPATAAKYHTKVINTSPKALMEGAVRILFREDDAENSAKAIVRAAVENFPNRGPVEIPCETEDLVAGFGHETIEAMLGGRYRAGYRPLNDNIMNGRVLGIAGVVGCNNPRTVHDKAHTDLVRELVANDVLVVETGCAAIACAKAGMLTPEAAFEAAGPGLREVCQAVGIPPVLHAGSCVDNSRILVAASEIVREGGLGSDFSDLPAAGVAPEWMSEKAVSIGQYFVGSGLHVVFGGLPLFPGGAEFHRYLTEGIEKDFRGRWSFEPDPRKIAGIVLDHLRRKRAALGIEAKKERVLFDMEMRRELQA